MKEFPRDEPDVEANQESVKQTMCDEPQESDAEMECGSDVEENFNSDTDDEDSSQDEYTEYEDEDFVPNEEGLADDDLTSDDEELPADNEEIPDSTQPKKENLEYVQGLHYKTQGLLVQKPITLIPGWPKIPLAMHINIIQNPRILNYHTFFSLICGVPVGTPTYAEPSFIVFYSMLVQLFNVFCFKCKDGNPKVTMKQNGTMVTVSQHCQKCGDNAFV